MKAHGDESELFRRHHDRLVAQVTSRLNGDHETAEEACALAWLQLLRYQPERTDQLYGWLLVTARREGYRLLRQRHRETPLEHAPEPSSAEDLLDQVDGRDRLRLLAELKPSQRRVLTLRAQGFSYAEIAELLGVSYTHVNRNLTEGRARLRRLHAAGR